MTDNGLAALAAALPLWMTERGAPDLAETIAATILGPRGVFLPDGLDAEFDFLARINAEQALTIATLRAALDGLVEAADFRASVEFEKGWHGPDLLLGIAFWMDKQDDRREAEWDTPAARSVQTDVRRWAEALRAALATARESGG